jgi:uncharacterized protein (UPF0332 family)
VSARSEARAHLAKAAEFLAAAELAAAAGLFNAAASDAVVSGINAKDAICLTLTGRSHKSDDHTAAIAELRRAGKAGAELGPTFQRLLNVKSRSQYQSVSVQQRQASDAVAWADRMYRAARLVVVR